MHPAGALKTSDIWKTMFHQRWFQENRSGLTHRVGRCSEEVITLPLRSKWLIWRKAIIFTSSMSLLPTYNTHKHRQFDTGQMERFRLNMLHVSVAWAAYSAIKRTGGISKGTECTLLCVGKGIMQRNSFTEDAGTISPRIFKFPNQIEAFFIGHLAKKELWFDRLPDLLLLNTKLDHLWSTCGICCQLFRWFLHGDRTSSRRERLLSGQESLIGKWNLPYSEQTCLWIAVSIGSLPLWPARDLARRYLIGHCIKQEVGPHGPSILIQQTDIEQWQFWVCCEWTTPSAVRIWRLLAISGLLCRPNW